MKLEISGNCLVCATLSPPSHTQYREGVWRLEKRKGDHRCLYIFSHPWAEYRMLDRMMTRIFISLAPKHCDGQTEVRPTVNCWIHSARRTLAAHVPPPSPSPTDKPPPPATNHNHQPHHQPTQNTKTHSRSHTVAHWFSQTSPRSSITLNTPIKLAELVYKSGKWVGRWEMLPKLAEVNSLSCV